MTQQEFEDKFSKSSLGEVWAFVENYISQAVSEPDIKRAAAEAELADKIVAIQKAEEALKNGDTETVAAALAAITETKQTEQQRQIVEIDRMIAELEAKKAELSKP